MLLVPEVGRKVTIIAVLFSILISCSESCLCFEPTYEPYPGNWVEVIRFESSNYSPQAEPFTIDCPDWRIRWEFVTLENWVWPFVFLNITVYPEGETANYVAQINGTGGGGIRYILDNPGTFYMKIRGGVIESYTIIIEQNIDSIPEFPSWTILPLLIVVTLVGVTVRNKIRKKVLE